MAREKTKHPELPKHVTLERGTYYYRVGKSPRKKLGSNFAEAMRELSRYERIHSGASLMGDIMDRYVIEVLPTKAESTQATNMSEMKLLRAAFGHMLPDDVTPADIYAYMDARPSVRANREKSLLSHVFVKAIRWGAASKNPCRDVESNPEFSRQRVPTPEELTDFLKHGPKWMKYYVDLKYITGLREKDILELTRSNLKEDGIELVNSKSKRYNPQTKDRQGKTVVIQWTPELRALVNDILALHGKIAKLPLFVTSNNTPYDKSAFHSVWQRMMKDFCNGDESKRFREHDIRALTASDDEQGAQKRLGHANASTTSIYIRSKEARTVVPLIPKFSGGKG